MKRRERARRAAKSNRDEIMKSGREIREGGEKRGVNGTPGRP